jgi:hypothetical protein
VTEGHQAKTPDRLYRRWLAATTLAGWAVAAAVPGPLSEKAGALVGVSAAAGCGLLALFLRRWTAERGFKATLWTLGILFGVRLVVLAAGIVASRAAGYGLVAFVIGFFAVYFALQWVEIGYLVRERNRAPKEEA